MRAASERQTRAYAKALEKASSVGQSAAFVDVTARLIEVMLDSEDEDARRAARNALIARVQAIYGMTAASYAAATDEFCRQALGVKPVEMEFTMTEGHAREIIGYVVKEVAGVPPG